MSKYCKCKREIKNPYVTQCPYCRKKIKRIKVRKFWNRNSQTQIKKSDKLYNRKKYKKEENE